MEVTDTIEVCADCLLFIANGDLPEDDGDADRVVAGVASLGGHVVAGGPDGDDAGFSWRACECCGGLAGDRFYASILAEVTS